MYEQSDSTNYPYKAIGVCYNNIGNLHLKNGKYQSAVLNFEAAILKAVEGQSKSSASFDYFERVKAHRRYQLAIAKYKALKYGRKKNY